MTNQYNYLKTVQYMDSFSIDNIGNFILEGYTDDGDKYYLIIRTVLGVSRILKIGPIQDGAKLFCSYQFMQLDYDDRKMDKLIQKWVSENKDITQIQIFDKPSKEDYLNVTKTLPNILEFLYD